MKPPTPAEQAQEEFRHNARRMTLSGGVRLDDLRALPTTDEEPFELATVQQKRAWLVARWMGAALLALACGAPESRFLTLLFDEPHGADRVCTYSDAIGARVLIVDVGASCPPYLESP